MITVVVCGSIAAGFLVALSLDMRRLFRVQRELEGGKSWQASGR